MGRNPFRLKQVSVRLKAERPLLSETPVKNPEDAARLVKELVSDFDREAVCIISLKNDLSPINFSICSIGSLNLALVEPRELIKTLCLSNATSFLMLHNHPGGSLSPSSQDVEITDRMSRLGSLLHIPMVDHVIVASGTNRYFSFKNQGILTFPEPKMETDYRNIHITDIVAVSAPHTPGQLDTYEVRFVNRNPIQIQIYNGNDGQGAPGSADPKMDGTAAPGAAQAYSREDHVHPVDTSRQAVVKKFNNQ